MREGGGEGGEGGEGVTHTLDEDPGSLVGAGGPLLELGQEVESVEGVHVLDVAEDDVLLALQSAGQHLRHKPRPAFLQNQSSFLL